MRVQCCLTSLFAVVLSQAAQAASVSMPNVSLQPNTPGQRIAIPISGGDLINGVDLCLQLTDGVTNTIGPTFSVDMADAQTIFGSTGGFTQGSAQSFYSGHAAYRSIAANLYGTNAPAEGVLAFVTFDTTGISSGSYQLKLLGTDLGSTALYDADANMLSLVANSPTVTVAVPEPTSVGLLGIAVIGLLKRRHRRQ